ncbi:SusC/RagA family TonB-linked outer membrane protein [Pedobacter sp. KR3-3]|uniref:SusC/RagA family TonB-linked outer membrane protein n=1 Tax=Pedobacter albus TaxID=3113905 RepID=A0ABU7IA72_9SPHI|nr:SusC/RagA family TonB-linked outer membrane protein [Pedobacter sp. KR3-3]MEE1946366.1 SusC/RagA family TonB-linked outer membrane protein [Pedobacter sp. KR3-3]
MRKLLQSLFLLMLFAFTAAAQNKTITGRVLGAADGLPIPGVSVKATGTNIGVQTNVEGRYVLSIPSSIESIEFSYLGFLTKTEVVGNRTTINVSLESDEKSLQEVIVTGYGSASRTKVTGAVGKVTSEKINDIPVGSIDQILQGRVPGLYVTAGSGQPGSNARVTIRGIGSINGSTQPLYVLDGIPIETGVFSTLNPADFESVTVLKDASSTAIYGSRGSNGVIVITSKRGKAGKVVFSANTQFGFSNRTSPKFEMLNTTQRLQFEEEVGLENNLTLGPGWYLSAKNPANAGLSTAEKARNAQMLDSLSRIKSPYLDIFFQKGKFQEHEVNASGGNENFRFYSSANYYKQEGIAVRSGIERYSFRTNVDFNQGRLSGSANVNAGFSNSSLIEQENSTNGNNPFSAAYYSLPYELPYVNGKLITAYNAATALPPGYELLDTREGATALDALLNSQNKSNQTKAGLSTNLRYRITNDLYAKTTFGIDYRETNGIRTTVPFSGYSAAFGFPGNQGRYTEAYTRNLQLTSTSGLTFAKTLNEKHDFEAQALFEMNRVKFKTLSTTGYGINPKLQGTPAGVTPGSAANLFIPLLTGNRSQSLLASFISSARYTYDDKYTVTGSYRYDGSSTIPSANRYKGFWSVGASWNAKKEDFIAKIDWLNELRVRGSYGLTAAPFISDFGYFQTYGNTRYGTSTGIAQTSPGNPEYDWEFQKQLDLGVDFSVWKNRARFVFDWYNRNTFNLFISQSLSSTSGFGSLNVNAGKMRNRGIEADVQVDVVSQSDLRVTLGANFNYNKNEITDLGQVNEFVLGTSIVRKGLPFGSHYQVKYAGVNTQTGEPMFYNLDGTITTNYNAATQSQATFGTYQPVFQGGFNLSASYKGLYFDAFFSFADQVTRFNNEDFFTQNRTFATSNVSTLVLKRWRKPGDVTDVQSISSVRRFSSADLQDASYIRFRNFNIGYAFPKKLMSKIKYASGIRVFLQGQNLYTWTKWRGFDPEDNNNIAAFEYPNARTYTLGLKVDF